MQLGNRALSFLDGQATSFTWLAGGTDLEEYTRARADLMAYDRRTLSPRRQGDPENSFASLAGDMALIEGPAGDTPLLGPAAADWFVKRHSRARTWWQGITGG